MIIDTHCHLYMEPFDADRSEVINRARQAGVKYLVNVGVDEETSRACYELSRAHKEIYHTVGFHPHNAHLMTSEVFNGLEALVRDTHPVAIGEVGLDYFKSEASPEVQKNVLAQMARLAQKNDLPLVIHSRDAQADTLDILRAEKARKGLMHCFSYDESAAKSFLDLGFLISFSCNVTFKNAAMLLEAAKKVPLDKIVIETDSPYLAPQVLRGKRNEPAHLTHLADFLAAARGVSAEEICRVTSENAIRLFGLKEKTS